MQINNLRKILNIPPLSRFTPEMRELFGPLRNEVTYLHGLWDTYEQLFGSEESISALNATAPGAFSFLGYVLRHELVMTICRVTDPMQMGRYENLTLARLLHVVSEQSPDKQFVAKLESQLKVIDVACQPFRERRNSTLGHLDLQTAMRKRPDRLPAIERGQFVDILKRIAEFMNTILAHCEATHADFTPLVTGPARNIVHGLREFRRLSKLELDRQKVELRSDRTQ